MLATDCNVWHLATWKMVIATSHLVGRKDIGSMSLLGKSNPSESEPAGEKYLADD